MAHRAYKSSLAPTIRCSPTPAARWWWHRSAILRNASLAPSASSARPGSTTPVSSRWSTTPPAPSGGLLDRASPVLFVEILDRLHLRIQCRSRSFLGGGARQDPDFGRGADQQHQFQEVGLREGDAAPGR